MAQPDDAVVLGEAFIVVEQHRMRIATHTLRGEVTDPLLAAPDAEIELRAGIDQEDHRVRERLVLTLPAGPINSLEGSFVLWVGASGAVGATVRGAKPTRSGEGVAVQLEARSDVEMEGRWAYSRQPGIREGRRHGCSAMGSAEVQRDPAFRERAEPRDVARFSPRSESSVPARSASHRAA